MIELKLDHNQKLSHRSFYISDERATEISKIFHKITLENKTGTISETIERIWNNEEMSLLEKIYSTFVEGRIQEK